MRMPLDPVRPIELSEIREAGNRIAKTIVRTPLVRLELGPGQPDIRLKLENLQPINAYKLRGAANAVAMLPEAKRKRGVWTISAGNAGQGVAYAAKQAGVPCSVVVVETAPQSKIERMRALGAKLIPVPYDVAWKALEERSFPGAEGTFIHPFDDDNFIAGHATMGLEILEDAPETAAVIASIGGGGLITGVASAVKALKPDIRVFGVEPETAAPAALSFEKGSPQVFKRWKASFEHLRRTFLERKGGRRSGLRRCSNEAFQRLNTCGEPFSNERAAGVQALESFVCGWRRWPKHVPSYVGTNETSRG